MKAILSNLFVLDEAFAKGAVRADFAVASVDVDKWASGECTRTIVLSQCAGNVPTDFIGTTHAGFYLLSQRVLSALEREKITGWRACDVEFRGVASELIHGYSAVGITARCGPLDNTRSKKVTRLVPSTASSAVSWIGIFFDEETWDGSDLFRPSGTMLTIATSRAKETLENIQATNIRFRRLTEVERVAL